MKTIIETERLLFREFGPGDSKDFFNLNADPEVLRYTGDSPFQSIDEAKEFLEKYADYKQNGFGRWAVINKSNHAFLGWCGLKLHSNGMIDIGFRFFRNQWRKGYATESARATLHLGFNTFDLNEIIGRASQKNLASIRVLEKLNMHFWKLDDCEGIPNAAYYRISKEQFYKSTP